MVLDVDLQGDTTIAVMEATDVTTEATDEIEMIDVVDTVAIVMRRQGTTTEDQADTTGTNDQGTTTDLDMRGLLGMTETTIVRQETIDHLVTDRLFCLLPRERVSHHFCIVVDFFTSKIGSM